MREDEIDCSYCGTVNRLQSGQTSCICEFCGKDLSFIAKEEDEISEILLMGKSVEEAKPEPEESAKETSQMDATEIDRLFEMVRDQYIREKNQGLKMTKKATIIALAVFVVLFLVSMFLMVSYFSRLSDSLMRSTFTVTTNSGDTNGG